MIKGILVESDKNGVIVKADTLGSLQALRKLGADISAVRPGCLAFCRSLFAEGRFAGHEGDTALDGEYTFYGLLALGCLEE